MWVVGVLGMTRRPMKTSSSATGPGTRRVIRQAEAGQKPAADQAEKKAAGPADA